MKLYEWDNHKNNKLKKERGISFEDIVFYVSKDAVLDIIKYSDKKKYSGQKIFVIKIENYAYLVPFIETDNIIFLKTIIPSRKATKKYLKR